MRWLFVGLCLLIPRASFACSAFCLRNPNGVVVGKSYDWYLGFGHGAVYVSPRGIEREAMVFDPVRTNPARWTSKFGSVSFSQFGYGIPTSGINENGLVVEVLQSANADYNSTSLDRPFVNEGEFAQIQLDMRASVQDVLQNLSSVRIKKAFTELHYFISDKTGDTATIDFVKGHAVVHSGLNMPVPALTNDEYTHLLEYAGSHPKTPPTQMLRRLSEVRFTTLRDLTFGAHSLSREDLLAKAWDGLEAVRLNGLAPDALLEPSQWNLVYDVQAGLIYFRTRDSRSIKSLDINNLNLSAGAPMLIADMNVPVAGDFTSQLSEYSVALNTSMVKRNWPLFAAKMASNKVGIAVAHGQVDACGRSLK